MQVNALPAANAKGFALWMWTLPILHESGKMARNASFAMSVWKAVQGMHSSVLTEYNPVKALGFVL